ncbi:hypothetical protein BD769DRAFT_1353204 [Suillus cothurnatus]|jgi:hypothetical protein|nr:hypothetical protein BD769DRAFT_1353204 [Suillus cothurnatus]
MDELSHLLRKDGINFNAVNHQIPCFPHIVNICVQHILDEYSTVDLSCLDDTFIAGPYTFKKVEYIKTLQSKVIDWARTIVHAICGSGQHRDSFQAAIISGNAEGWFVNDNNECMALPLVELLCDEPAHWDSTYVMLNHLRIL